MRRLPDDDCDVVPDRVPQCDALPRLIRVALGVCEMLGVADELALPDTFAVPLPLGDRVPDGSRLRLRTAL